MAELSDQLLVVAILAYLAAMVCHAAEYAMSAGRATATATTRIPELVGAGVGATVGGGGAVDAGTATPAPPVRRSGRLGRIALLAAGVAALAHAGSLITRGAAAGRVPWGNMYEFVLAGALVGALAWLVVALRWPATRQLGLFVALTEVVLLGLAGMVLYAPAGPLVPALQSYWLVIHVTAAVIASGVFLVGFVAAAMFLIRTGHDAGKARFPYTLGPRVPSPDVLERLTFRLHAFGFPIWTFAVIAGAIWAEAAWGRYWGWDPKETWAFISWVVYAGYLHARATPSVRRSTVMWIALLGWASMMMNLFGVNIFISGLHSYAGL